MMRAGLSAIHAPGVVAMVLALGVSGTPVAEAGATVARHHRVATTAKKKHHKKHAPKPKGKRTPHHKSGQGLPTGSRSLKIDSAVATATGTTDYVGVGSDQADVKITVATPTPVSDGVLVYVTKGGCFQSLSDANQYNTNQFVANEPSSVGDHTVAQWLNEGAPAGGASATFDAVGSIANGYSTVCATIYSQKLDPITQIVTNTPYFTINAPLTSG